MSGPPLKVGIVGIAHPMRGGIAQYTAILARELSRRHRVEFVSYSRQYPSILFPGQTQIDASEDPVRYPAVPLVDSIGPGSWFHAADYLAARGPDVVVLKYWMPFFAPSYGTILRRLRAKMRSRPPVTIMIIDNLIPHEPRPFDLPLTRWLMRVTDGYIAQSGAVRADLLRLHPKARYREVPHPVYNLFGPRIDKREARRALGLDPEQPLLLFFGFVRRYKGLDLLLRAMPRVRSELEPAPRLLVLGEFYEERAETTALVNRLGLTAAVDLIDAYVPNEKVGLYFSAADVVVLPYRSATQSGIVQIAWQLERPVICTDVGGLAEVVRHEETGLVVPPEDPEALAAAVVRYYRERLEEGLVARIAVEKELYSWDRMIDAIEDLVLEIRASRERRDQR